MSDEEIISTILHHGELSATHELANSISMVREDIANAE
jgi:hypothetical protein